MVRWPVVNRLPSLHGLRAFDAVGRTGSIRAAGEQLAVSPTVISRHLQNLQADLGVALLEAQGRRLVLTPAGRAFHEQVQRAFEILRRASADARNNGERPSLSIWCMPGIANRRLPPHLPELVATLPDHEILLQPTLSRPDFRRDHADAEIVYLEALEPVPHIRAALLAQPRIFPLASPSLCARLPRIDRAADLLHAPLIHEESTRQWQLWFRAAGIAEVPTLRGPRLWHAHLALEAARDGQGIALGNDLLSADDLASGRLVELGNTEVRLGAYYLVAPTAYWERTEIGALHAWLRRVMEAPAKTDAFPAS
jgi:DNA-binding transcriptional LysR family regulator